MGSAALYHLTKLGASPLGIEQFRVGHTKGSSSGHSRVFRSLYDSSCYTEMVQESYPLWRELEARSGRHLLTLNGMIFIGNDGNELLHRNIERYQQSGLPYEIISSSEANRRHPALSIRDKALICYTPFAGFLDASRCVDTHVAMAVSGGAEVHQECKVLSINLSNEHPEVHTSKGTLRARRLILTGGPWTADLLADLAIPLKVTRQQKCYFTCDRHNHHLPTSLPVYADYETDYYGFPWYGSGVKVANDIHGPRIHPDQVDRTPDMELAANLQNWLQNLMPSRRFTYHSTDTCMYTVTPDGDFILGPHPEHTGVILGAGFSGHGFKFTALIGKWLAELALREETDFDISRFSPERFSL